MDTKKNDAFSKGLALRAVKDAFRKLNPKTQIENPVMFIVYIAARCV